MPLYCPRFFETLPLGRFPVYLRGTYHHFLEISRIPLLRTIRKVDLRGLKDQSGAIEVTLLIPRKNGTGCHLVSY